MYGSADVSSSRGAGVIVRVAARLMVQTVGRHSVRALSALAAGDAELSPRVRSSVDKFAGQGRWNDFGFKMFV